MKKVKSFRIDEKLEEEILLYAKQMGVTFSQFVEYSLYQFFGKKPTEKYKVSDELSDTMLNVRVGKNLYRDLSEIVEDKNTTFSQEIRYRLLATLNNPSYDVIELKALFSLKADLNRLGNLLKLAINESAVDADLIKSLEFSIKNIEQEIANIGIEARKREL